MTHREKHAEASLLYTSASAPLAEVDTVALRAVLDRMGYAVESIRVQRDEFVQLICHKVQVLVVGFDRPFPMDHFRGVSRPPEDTERQSALLSRLSQHRSSLTVLVMDLSDHGAPEGETLRAAVCDETVDFLLASTDPDMVFWSSDDQLETAAEAEAALEVPNETKEADNWMCAVDYVQPRRTVSRKRLSTPRPATFPLPPQPGDIDLSAAGFRAKAADVRPKKPALTACRSERPAYLLTDPHLSPDVAKWFDGEDDVVEAPEPSRELSALRAFLALDDSPEPRRIADTASGRASLYLMSATIAVFALPVGASMLTYNALSGGSFRATSHVMALTGIGLALTSLGMPSPAAALTLAF